MDFILWLSLLNFFKAPICILQGVDSHRLEGKISMLLKWSDLALCRAPFQCFGNHKHKNGLQ